MRSCSVDGCDRAFFCKGLCSRHYDRARLKDPKRRDYNKKKCREWYSHNRQKALAYARRYAESAGEEQKLEWKLRAKYKIGVEDYKKLLNQQQGKCAVCGANNSQHKVYDRLCVDHCHKTGLVRGLLCHTCNTAIGNLRDNPELCESAAAYLRLHKKPA